MTDFSILGLDLVNSLVWVLLILMYNLRGTIEFFKSRKKLAEIAAQAPLEANTIIFKGNIPWVSPVIFCLITFYLIDSFGWRWETQLMLLLFLLPTVLDLFTARFSTVEIDELQITCAEWDKNLDIKDITEFEIMPDQVNLHTIRWRNDHELKKSKLFQPDWDAMKTKFEVLAAMHVHIKLTYSEPNTKAPQHG